ncbi:RND family transporter [Chloroflexota bacterium]
MESRGEKRKGFYGWLGNTLERRSPWLVFVILLITMLLVVPLFLMPPTETASDNPSGNDTVIWYEEVRESFPSEVYTMVFIAEAIDGDIITQESLYQLYQNQETLREGDLSPFLHQRHSELTGDTTLGIYTIADTVNTALMLGSNGLVSLANATDTQVKQAINGILSNPQTEDLEQTFSIQADYKETAEGVKLWTSPALLIVVQSDRETVIEDYPTSAGQEYTANLALEHFSRDVLEILRSQQEAYQIWGLNIDLQLEIADEGRINTPMLIAAITLILFIVAVIFRSSMVTLISGLGLGMVLIWLKGFSNFIGLKSSVIIELIVPITILVLGIDYAIHALFRYREEKRKGYFPKHALGNSTQGVGSALVLAMLTTIVAFGSNAVSGIESIEEFAIAASAAIFATFIILGFFVPSIAMWFDNRRSLKAIAAEIRSIPVRHSSIMGDFASWFSNKWFLTLPLILIVTTAFVWGWLNLETRLDPEEALDPQSDFVTGIDKLDEHVAQKAGEPAILYIKGDFTQPEALEAMKAVVYKMEDDEHVARQTTDGQPNASTPLLDYLAVTVASDYARQQIEAASGVTVTDTNDDLIPDTSEQLSAVYSYLTEQGIPLDENTILYTPQQIKEVFSYNESDNEYATLISIGVPGTREQAIVRESADELNNDMEEAMSGVPDITFYGLTGDAYVRDAQFSAITSSMNNSLLIAIATCLVLLVIVFRSLRYAIVTLIPVMLVVCWLYGLMYVMGYHINLMTATIAAISVGVGIDFSIHFTERFRQELRRSLDKRTAIYNTARSTGVALLGTTLSTASGFAVIAFAPMPMFATFGVLTAVMIILSFLMALFALPSLLLLFAPGIKSNSGTN